MYRTNARIVPMPLQEPPTPLFLFQFFISRVPCPALFCVPQISLVRPRTVWYAVHLFVSCVVMSAVQLLVSRAVSCVVFTQLCHEFVPFTLRSFVSRAVSYVYCAVLLCPVQCAVQLVVCHVQCVICVLCSLVVSCALSVVCCAVSCVSCAVCHM